MSVSGSTFSISANWECDHESQAVTSCWCKHTVKQHLFLRNHRTLTHVKRMKGDYCGTGHRRKKFRKENRGFTRKSVRTGHLNPAAAVAPQRDKMPREGRQVTPMWTETPQFRELHSECSIYYRNSRKQASGLRQLEKLRYEVTEVTHRRERGCV